MSGNKYTIRDDGRVVALKTFAPGDMLGGFVVRAGDVGGFVDREQNLSQFGSCWISGDAEVRGDAEVSDSALVCGKAVVKDSVRVCGSALIGDNAVVTNFVSVMGRARVLDDAKLSGYVRVTDRAQIYGNARAKDHVVLSLDCQVHEYAFLCERAHVSDRAIVYGHARLGGRNTRLLGRSVFRGNAYVSKTPPRVGRSDGYDFVVFPDVDGTLRVSAGCRYFTFDEAYAHWTSEYMGVCDKYRETQAILEYLRKAGEMTYV